MECAELSRPERSARESGPGLRCKLAIATSPVRTGSTKQRQSLAYGSSATISATTPLIGEAFLKYFST